jgi:4-hydroxy-tetrahydrodipicolinate synthase
MGTIRGVWLPIVTPFVDGAVDVRSYAGMVEHYLGLGVSGIFPLGTTGESPTLDADEMEAIVETTVSVVGGRVPVYVGISGNATARVVKTLARYARYPFEGFVVVCPYYNRPGQDGSTCISGAWPRRPTGRS